MKGKAQKMYFGEFEFAGYDFRTVGSTKGEVNSTLKREYERQVRLAEPRDKMSWAKYKECTGVNISRIEAGKIFGPHLDDEE